MGLLLLLALLAAGFFGFGAPRVRRARFAGSWYEGDPGRLRSFVDGLLASAPSRPLPGRIVGLVAPHAGYRWSGPTAAAAYAAIKGGPFERVFVLAPSHRVAFRGARLPGWDAYETPLGEVPLDRDLCEALRSSPGLREERPGEGAQAEAHEHSLELQIPFLQRALGPFRLVPVLVGDLEGEGGEIAARLRSFVDGRTLVVASSDLTHYGEAYAFHPFPADDPALAEKLRAFDGELIDAILRADGPGLELVRRRSGINACGADAIRLLLSIFPRGYRGSLLEYRTSGEVSGDWSSSVSYGAIVLSGLRPVLSEEEGRACLELARAGVRAAVLGEAEPAPPEGGLPRALREKGAAFVTVRREGELRGCVGHVHPDRPLWKTIVESAASAALRDGRFDPVRPDELPDLRHEVTVLGGSRAIADPADFALGEEGAVLRLGELSAVFLPQVATEQRWDRETFFRNLARKAGLDPARWREATIEAFGAAPIGEGGSA